MADMMLGELFVLLLLVPAVLRPFSRKIQELQSVIVLPFVAAVLAGLLFWAYGLSVSLIFVSCIVLFTVLTCIPETIRYAQGLVTDWHGPGVKTVSIVQLLLIAGCACFLFLFWPEPLPDFAVREERVPLSGSARTGFSPKTRFFEKSGALLRVWYPEAEEDGGNGAPPYPVVLYVPDIFSDAAGWEAGARFLASAGYVVAAADFTASDMYPGPPVLFRLARYAGADGYIPPASERIHLKRAELSFLVQIWEQYASAAERQGLFSPELFVYAEGAACFAADEYRAANPGKIWGALYAESAEPELEQQYAPFAARPDVVHLLLGRDGVTQDSGRYSAVLLAGEQGDLFGFGSMNVLHVFEAVLYGGARDKDCRRVRLSSGIAGSYFRRRGAFLAGPERPAGAGVQAESLPVPETF